MRKMNVELVVGSFVLASVLCFVYLTVQVGRLGRVGGRSYQLQALFTNVGGLKAGSTVFIAGVPVGAVESIALEDYQANVVLVLPEDVKVQEDAIASVKTRGMLGETYLEIAPGGSDVLLRPGERLRETEPAIDLQSLIAKYAFSDQSGGGLE